MTKDEVLLRIREVAQDESPLSQARFCEVTGVGLRLLKLNFDSWAEACKEAGVTPAPTGKINLRSNPAISRQRCIEEIKRVATLLEKTSLSRAEFNQHAHLSMRPIVRHFGTWTKALKAAGLTTSSYYFEPIPLADFAAEFLRVVGELKKIPSVRQLARRSKHGEYCFTRKFGTYDEFKRRVIGSIVSQCEGTDVNVRKLLENELVRISAPEAPPTMSEHLHGRTLGFRAFAYAPTYENEVVALFSAVAHELGFEIICSRAAFPDCETQRRIGGDRERFKKCLIEFELRSSDFVKHGHSIAGCDLIVCWEHDWTECPLEVLELRRVIRALEGWR